MSDSAPPGPSADAAYDELRQALAALLPEPSRPPAEGDAPRIYREVGRLINDHLAGRAAYGTKAVARLADDTGILRRTLYRARRVAERLPAQLPDGLTWSHCRLLVTVEDDEQRERLMQQAAVNRWSVRRLQQEVQAEPDMAVVAPSRAGTYRIVAAGQQRAFDLGFGLRHPLRLAEKPGKKTRRLLADLAPGDIVETATDDKGRPALRRVHGLSGARLHAYDVLDLRAVARGVVWARLDLGFDLAWEGRLHLETPAQGLARERIAAGLAAHDGALRARTVARDRGYGVDLFDAAGGQHLNSRWPSPVEVT